MYVEHNKPNWDKLQAISVLTSDSPKLGPALKKNPYTNAILIPETSHSAKYHHRLKSFFLFFTPPPRSLLFKVFQM